MQLLADLCSGMDLSQITAFAAPSEDTPLSTKTSKKLQVGLKNPLYQLCSIRFIIIITLFYTTDQK